MFFSTCSERKHRKLLAERLKKPRQNETIGLPERDEKYDYLDRL